MPSTMSEFLESKFDASCSELSIFKRRTNLSLSAGWFFAALRSPGDRPLTLASGALGEPRPLIAIRLVRLGRVASGGGALVEVRLPSAAVAGRRVVLLVDLHDVGDGALQEPTVVGDEDHRRGRCEHEGLEAVEPVEVQVVRRLVEEEDVEAREDGATSAVRAACPPDSRAGSSSSTSASRPRSRHVSPMRASRSAAPRWSHRSRACA